MTRITTSFQGVKKAMRDLVVTQRGIVLIGREVEKTGPNKGQELEVVTRRIDFGSLYQVQLMSIYFKIGRSNRDFKRLFILKLASFEYHYYASLIINLGTRLKLC